ncbi:PepSY domain-containing protein [Croceibacterium sp. LX-88]|uniref:PepSY domain-containing protein n=1 Tax=Croceibacterium selenioxidans TaxID=2838833 RepID=A0ABS5W411_9SPHN|nr:PepSY-associated TM helix domain-containing protein [Croceibacterium selenioxidans]MBT2134498.1 PepSY domain-containing protein [Croceibacterium selenioxidans]
MRRAIVKLHRWVGIILLIYVALISLTGSVLVYRPELYRLFEPQPLVVSPGPRLLSDEEILQSAGRAFPAETAIKVWRGRQPNHAVEVDLESEGQIRNYLFDPYSGHPLGPTLPLGFRVTSALLKFHTELVGGETGRLANGALALSFVFLALSGALVWRPRRGRDAVRTPVLRRPGGLRYLHMTAGIWAAALVFTWGLTGLHLVFPGVMESLVDFFEPFDEANPVERTGDKVAYWLAYLHFGRFGGRIPGCGPGPCGESLKVFWSFAALVPVFLAGSGLLLWWRGRRARLRVKSGARQAADRREGLPLAGGGPRG